MTRERAGSPLGRLISLLPLPILLAACAAGPDPSATLSLALDSGPGSLDPRLGSDEASRRVNELLYSGLFRIDDSGRPIGDLAESYRWLDARTLVVVLRDGVRFHDGSPLSSRDVVYTYRSILTDEVHSFRKGDLEALRTVQAEDDRRILFRLRRSFAPILTDLNVPILRAGAGVEAARRPIGSGPFRLLRYRKDEDLLLARFDNYFDGPAGVAAIRLRIIPSETSRLMELLTGGVDLILNDLSPDQFARVRRTPGFEVESRPGRNYVYMTFNLRDPILGDHRVREAIARALDREAIVTHLLHGEATLASGLLPPGHWAYEGNVLRYPCDPAAAASILERAGYRDRDGPGPAARLRLGYKTVSSELGLQQASVIQEQLARAGIGLDIAAYEWPTFYDDLKSGRFQVAVSNWTEISDPDIFRLRFHSRSRPPDGFNRGGYENPVVDRLIEMGAADTDETARRRIYAEIQRILARDLPYVSLWHRDVAVARSLRVRGFQLTSGADFLPLRKVVLGSAGGSGEPAPEKGLDGGNGDRARADHPRGIDRQIENRRGGASGRGAAIENQREVLAEHFGHFGGGHRGRAPGAIGARRDDRGAGGPGQASGDRMRGEAHSHRPRAPQEARRKPVGGRQDEGQRAGPEVLRQHPGGLREFPHAELDSLIIGGDQRQGHLFRPALGEKDLLDGLGIVWVGTQSVEGLGGIRDQTAGGELPRRPLQESRVGMQGVDSPHQLHDRSPRPGLLPATIADPPSRERA
jgi:peptide/nickel transport system substrate-binding protein